MSDNSTPVFLQEPLANGATSDSFDPTLLARFFRVLGDPTRLRLLTLLLERDQTVSELVEALSAPQGRVSTHLGCLRWCGFVTARRAGRPQEKLDRIIVCVRHLEQRRISAFVMVLRRDQETSATGRQPRPLEERVLV